MEIQVLDGMLDPNLHDEQGRKHGVFEFVGEPYPGIPGTFWKLVVTYRHGQQEFPVRWLNPAGVCEQRSRSFWEDDQKGVGPIILRPDGWTRIYHTTPYDCEQSIIWEGFKGISTPREHLAYENGQEIVFRNRWTRNLHPRPITKPPPEPNKWPVEWDHRVKRKVKRGSTISSNGVYKPWTSSNTSTT